MSDANFRSRHEGGDLRWPIVLFAAMIGLCTMLITPGCTKALFPDTAARTQFDHYDLQRGQFVERRQYDVYGKPIPSIRERLRIR